MAKNTETLYGTIQGQNQPTIKILSSKDHFCSLTYKYQTEKVVLNYFLSEVKGMILELKLEPIYKTIRLNLYYKPSNILLKYFLREGFEVKCYYQKPQK